MGGWVGGWVGESWRNESRSIVRFEGSMMCCLIAWSRFYHFLFRAIDNRELTTAVTR